MKDAYTVALGMVKLSVQQSERSDDGRYLIDYTKLHKLLYYAQCFSLAKYGSPLFYEDVVRQDSGPWVEELSRFYGNFGLGEYTAGHMAGVRMPEFSKREKDALLSVIASLGRMSSEELAWKAKQSAPFQKKARFGSVLSKEDMRACALSEFHIAPVEQEGLDVAGYVRDSRRLLMLYGQYRERAQRRNKKAGKSQRASANRRMRERNEYPRGNAAR